MSFASVAAECVKIGSRIKVFADDGIFEGTVHVIDNKHHVLTLRNVLNLETGIQEMKMCQFATKTIKRFVTLEDSVKSTTGRRSTSNLLLEMAGFKQPTKHLTTRSPLNPDLLANSWKLNGSESEGKVVQIQVSDPSATGSNLDAEDSNSGAEGSNSGPTDSSPGEKGSHSGGVENSSMLITLIDVIAEDFYSSIGDIQTQSVIGLAAQGIAIGRNGQLCLLQITTARKCYVYDMLALKEDAFVQGLKDVLESKTVQKVVYNCRSLSDMLLHQYDIILDNVFDIQVAEIALYQKSHGRNMPRFVSSLAACCTRFLKLPLSDIFFQRVRQYSKQLDESIWSVRPASSQMLEAAHKNVAYLRPLRHVMMRALLKDFMSCVDVYLQSYQRCSNDEYQKSVIPRTSSGLPQELVRVLHRQNNSNLTKTPVFEENYDVATSDPWIAYSHDGISHGLDPNNDPRSLYARHSARRGRTAYS